MFSYRSSVDVRPNALALARERLRQTGRPVLDLTLSNPTDCGFLIPHAALDAFRDAEVQRYAPDPAGLPAAREEVARDYARRNLKVVAEDIFLTASTSEAYAFLLKLLCNPGDVILVPTPSYPLLEHLARLEGVHIQPYPLRFDGVWHVDTAELRRLAGEVKARAVVVVQPNNPTGSFVSPGEWQALHGLGIPIISDEVFADYAFEDVPVPSVLPAEQGLVFSLGGLSKTVGLPQMKLGWMALGGDGARVAEARQRLDVIADTYLSVNTPVQVALPTLLREGAQVRQSIRDRLRLNLETLRGLARGTPVSVLPVQGGWSAVLRLPRTQTDTHWALQLLEEDGVLVQPGYFYDFAQEAVLVLSLLVPPSVMHGGCQAIMQRVEVVGR